MKTAHFLAIMTFALMLTSAGNVLAQTETGQGRGKGHDFGKGMESGIPNLTEEQKSKIKEINLVHFKEMQTYRNQLGELKAKERTLTTADKPDMKAINANIDEITKVQNQLMKGQAAHHQQIRALLTDEQRLWFDSHQMQKRQHAKMRNHMGDSGHKDECKGQ